MRKTKPILMLLVAAIASWSAALATEYYVDVNTGDDANSGLSPDEAYSTISHALDVATSIREKLGVIQVAAGTYSPESGETFPLEVSFMYGELWLIGEGPEATTIDFMSSSPYGSGSIRIRNAGVVVEGFRITGATYGAGGFGGAVSAWMDSGIVTLRNCTITGNHAPQSSTSASAVSFWSGTSRGEGEAVLEMEDCIIEDNSGGASAIYVFWQKELNMRRCVIRNNDSAGIVAGYPSLSMTDCVVADNRYAAVCNIGPTRMSNCLITGGRLKASDWARWEVGRVAHVLFDGNAVLEGCTFADNACASGGTLYVGIGDTAEIKNCIFRNDGDEIVEQQPGHVVLENTCIEGDWAGAGEGSFDADPLFVTGPFGDYYLSQTAAGQAEDSPCVDAGSMTAAEAGMSMATTRIDGIPDGGIVDVGYHYLMMPEVRVSMPSVIYTDGETLEVLFEATNPNSYWYPVDVYAAIVNADGAIWTVDSSWAWSGSLNPWFMSLELPPHLTFGPTPLLSLAIPSQLPPISNPGRYWAAAVFTLPGTFDFVCRASLAPFKYEETGETAIMMVPIPAGSFLMGSPDDETGHDPDEGPQRTVNISTFLMSRTEITEKQWEHVMGWNDSCYHMGDNYPIENLSWWDCLSFCNELSEAQGLNKCYTFTVVSYTGHHITGAWVTCDFEADGYRLPTEAEWEYACRAGTSTRFYTGDADADAHRAGWLFDGSGHGKCKVGQKEPNAFGLYDMHGNISEWCWDCYASDYYGTRPDPDSDPIGPTDSFYRVYRGGCFRDSAERCRSGSRTYNWPRADYQDSMGLRIARPSR